MPGNYIVIDTGSIINLFASGGEQAWDLLLQGDRQIIVSTVILDELEQFADREAHNSPLANIREKFDEFRANSGDSIPISGARPDLANYPSAQ